MLLLAKTLRYLGDFFFWLSTTCSNSALSIYNRKLDTLKRR